MSVTLHEVANAAGVSIKTVSNVVRGQGSFSEETRQRVLRAVEELGYRPNLAARGLRSGRLGVIGLVVPDIRNPYFAELADAVMRAASRRDHLVVIEQSDGDRATELELLRGRGTRMVDGILFSVLGLGDGDPELQDGVELPVVVLGEPVPGWQTDFVSMRHDAGVQAATTHLIAGGRSRIAAIGARWNERVGSAQLRLAGYRSALEAAGLPFDPDLVIDVDLWGRSQGADAARRLLARDVPFDAVVAFNDAMALGAMRHLDDQGLRIPEDVAVVGFDDIDETRYSVPTLSTVRPAVTEIAETAISYLLDRIMDTGPAEARSYRATCELEIRESSRSGVLTSPTG